MITSILVSLWLSLGLLAVLILQWALNHPEQANLNRLEHDVLRRQFALTALIILLLGPLAFFRMVKIER